MGLLAALNAGKTSLLSNQKAIEITGENVTNVNTPGYSRQTPTYSPYPAMAFGDFFIGTGVKISSVERAHDVFIHEQLKDRNASSGFESARTAPLEEIEQVVGVDSDTSISAQFDTFFDDLQQLSTNPNGLVERSQVLQQGQLLANSFQNTYTDLQKVGDDLNNKLSAQVDDVNLKLKQVAELNQRIATIENSGQNANSDRDRRDLLLTQLANTIGATSIEDANGNAIVSLPNSGLPLVSGDGAMQLQAVDVGGTLNFKLDIGGGTVVDLPPSQFGGQFGGLIDVRDRVLPDVMGQLDTLAYNFANEFNTLHQAGTGLDGVSGRDFFTDFSGWANADGAALALNVTATSTDEVAAGTSAAPGDNTNVLSLMGLENSPIAGLGNDNFVAYYGKIASGIGIEVNQNSLTSQGLEDSLNQLQNLRDSTDGVSIEEEMIQLMKYQQSFQASAKLLSTVDDVMGSLLDLKR